ncbi:3-phenylpropionate/trans-cinnamate dioxygenase ferredoxin reductase subunit [Meinhardsimonia xiamenensis]|jgi:3-phenylpropionate/trans-cinnamate dioxygenase ferredoxin reductase subunit|uniref:3-phenylpropionate/trans-cinnamate dioxygenase ferredoxin reductase subunit n=1 Tax=Meinhardsimonia xiamenensis TaxID=990712 RepID=A0A1G8XW59_9RHOB|nr:FAD-dependent oxidoreductase [Meinhardsimonia xiamenensis]PRX37067.1 3-phenylpropionate/trans-cinnamate dioxygenase ferredoxin reductase subunit [Meinhardsimonia xiamenensis]SDJ94753.1 3-phenylpropionate/trans-cinnamate dioxygenase ferredoxin reductase subunit [Meinhardsimonia xiamenensis]
MERIVIVGAGQAAQSLAAKLRALGHAGPITLIGEEPVPPYQRPPLSKAYLLGEMERERLYLRPESWYDEQDIALLTGTPVTAIDRAARTVAASGREIPYDRLALTTGAVPRRLPAAIGGDLAGVYTVRTLADVDAMAPEFAAGRRVLIVGGGYIGLEAAAVARKKGLEVTLVEAAPRILARVACTETAAWFAALHRAHGVDLREGVTLERLTGEAGRVTGAALAGGETVTADFVIVGIGVVPDTRLAEAAGLAIDNGIAVGEFCRASDPLIWAAGDCASFPWRGRRVRLESVGNAIDMGEAAAANMLGQSTPYVAKPWFWSDQYDVKLQIAGLSTGYDRVVTRGDPEAGQGAPVSFWYYAGAELLAVDAINDPRAYMVGKRLIEAGKSPHPEAVADTGTELKALL